MACIRAGSAGFSPPVREAPAREGPSRPPAVTVVHLPRPLGLHARAVMSRYLDPAESSKPYKDPTPLPADVPKVKELGVTSAPLKSAAFFLGAYCKDYNGEWPAFDMCMLAGSVWCAQHAAPCQTWLSEPYRHELMDNLPAFQRISCFASRRTGIPHIVSRRAAE